MIRRPTLRRSAVIALEVMAGSVAALSVLLMLAFWRLTAGPIALDFLRPYTESALEQALPGYDIALERTQIVWEAEEKSLKLEATDVRIAGHAGGPTASVPAIQIRFSLRGLLRGLLAPVEIEAVEPAFSVVRLRDGSLRLGPPDSLPDEVSKTAVTDDALTLIAEELNRAPDPDSATGYLEIVRVRRASLTIIDLALGTQWSVPSADILLRRGERGVRSRGMLEFDLGTMPLMVSFEGSHRLDDRTSRLSVEFSGLEPDALARKVPALAALSAVGVPLSGSVEIEAEALTVARSIEVNVRGQGGQIDLPTLYDLPLPVRAIAATVNYRRDSAMLMLPSLVIDLGTAAKAGPRLSLTGTLIDVGNADSYGLVAEAVAENVTTDDLAGYWPREVGRNPRRWVTANLEGGGVSRARISLRGRMARDDPSDLAVEDFDGEIAFSGVTTHYMRPLPPVLETAGRAEFSPGRFKIDVESGRLYDLVAGPATIDLTGLDGKKELADIEVVVRGPLRDVMRVIDHKPLDYATALGIPPANVDGLAAARLVFQFPLVNDLGLDRVKLAAAANMRGVSLSKVLLDQDFRDGELALTLDGRGMTIEGTGRFADVPIPVTWREEFRSNVEVRRRIQASGILDDAARIRLGFDFQPYLTGPVATEIDYRQASDGTDRIAATHDLRDATLSLPEVGWTKPPQIAGMARLNIAIPKGGDPRFERFQIAASDLAAVGQAEFTPDFEHLRRVDFTELKLGQTDIEGSVVRQPDGGLDIDLSGRNLDLRPALAEEEGEADDTPPTFPALRLNGRFQRVLLEDDRLLDGVEANLVHDGTTWRDVKIAGRLAEAGRFDLVATPITGASGHEFILVSDDAGAALRSFGLFDRMVGGRLRVDGRADFDDFRKPIQAALDIADFRIVRAEALAEVLRVTGSQDIQSALAGEGIVFTRLTGDIERQDKVTRIRNARAVGAALGLSVDGVIDDGNGGINVSGLIVPAYQLSQALGSIPLLGPLIVGGKDEGLLATEFRLDGPADNPRVTVNPLTALAPGFLRDLFRFFGDRGGDTAPAQPTR